MSLLKYLIDHSSGKAVTDGNMARILNMYTGPQQDLFAELTSLYLKTTRGTLYPSYTGKHNTKLDAVRGIHESRASLMTDRMEVLPAAINLRAACYLIWMTALWKSFCAN